MCSLSEQSRGLQEARQYATRIDRIIARLAISDSEIRGGLWTRAVVVAGKNRKRKDGTYRTERGKPFNVQYRLDPITGEPQARYPDVAHFIDLMDVEWESICDSHETTPEICVVHEPEQAMQQA